MSANDFNRANHLELVKPAAEAALLPTSANTAGTRSRRLQILVVDDQGPILHLLEQALGCEHDVSTRQDAAAALATLSSESFDVVISDYNMPGMNGVELLRRIGLLWPSVVRVLMSGAPPHKLQVLKRDPAVQHFLRKPLHLRAAQELVRRTGEAIHPSGQQISPSKRGRDPR